MQGTINVIQGSVKQRVKKVIDVSTDKAALPINFYGMTKSIGERLMIQANLAQPSTRFVCIRGGNVLGTNGSVVPYFKQLIQEGKEITLTSREMTRFFLTISSAIELLLKAAKESLGGETFVMKMPACRILDLAEVMIDALATQPVSIRETGIRPGEKLHEVLITPYESLHTYRYSDQYFVMLHGGPNHPQFSSYQSLEKVSFKQYQSNSDLMSKEEIGQMLHGEGFI